MDNGRGVGGRNPSMWQLALKAELEVGVWWGDDADREELPWSPVPTRYQV